MHRFTLHMVLCSLIVCALPPFIGDAEAGFQKEEVDELVKEFKRYYRPRRPVEEKIEAIYVLKNAEPLQAVQVLVKALDDPAEQVREVAIETMGGLKDPRCVTFLIENYITNKKEKKLHRIVSAVRILGLIGDESALDPILLLWRRLKHNDFKRAMGEALGNMKSAKALPILFELFKDDDPRLRLIAVDGMTKINKPDAVLTRPEETTESSPRCKDALIGILEEGSEFYDNNWQIRASAIAALRKMRFKEAIQPMIDCLRREEGRLRGDAYEALKELTFSQYGEDPDEWQKYWDRVKDRFEMADLEVVLAARKKKKEQGSRYHIATPRFAGIPTKSRKIIFVVDISKSMDRPVMDTARYKEAGREYRTYARLEIVKDELTRTIENFDQNVDFNILAFATGMRWWKKDLVTANILNRNSAVSFINNLEAIGSGSTSFRARSGLKGAQTLTQGKTNTFGALMTALGFAEDGSDINKHKLLNYKVDTIYFLSDGEPSVGTILDDDEIVSVFTKANESRKVVLNTIAIGDFKKQFLKKLAKANGGVYVDLGK